MDDIYQSDDDDNNNDDDMPPKRTPRAIPNTLKQPAAAKKRWRMSATLSGGCMLLELPSALMDMLTLLLTRLIL